MKVAPGFCIFCEANDESETAEAMSSLKISKRQLERRISKCFGKCFYFAWRS